jgi:hypothetical protein
MAEQEQDRMAQEAERPPAAVLQRLRRVSRQVWNRSHWGSAMTRRWRFLLRRLGRRSDAADTGEE